MRVLVTDSDTRPALAIARSLARAGHHVVTCGHIEPALAGASRSSAVHEPSPSPSREPAAFAAFVRELAKRHAIDVLLPVTEVSTLTLVSDPELQALGVRHPFASAEVVAAAADKACVLRTAREIGIPTPRTIELDAPSAGDFGDGGLGFPVVVKPSRSRVRTARGWIGAGTAYAHDTGMLRDVLARIPPALFPVLLQERILGPGVGVFACIDHGQRVACFAHRRIREMPPSGGVSVLCESCEPDPDALAHADRLLARIGWRGPAMVEFKRDSRDGSLRLMEINGRFWGSLQLAIDAGVDFPRLAVDMAGGAICAGPENYRVGVRSRWLLGDLNALLLRLRYGSAALDLPPDDPGTLRALASFLGTSFDPATRNDVAKLSDPKPFVVELRRWLAGGRA